MDWTECLTHVGFVDIPLLWGLVISWLLGCSLLLHSIAGVGLCALTCIWFMLFLNLFHQVLAATLLSSCKVDTSPLPVFERVGLCLHDLSVCLFSAILFGGFWLVFARMLLPLMDVFW